MSKYQQDPTRELISRLIPINRVFRECFPRLWRDLESDYSVVCPLHRDTKPSLRIYQSKNFAKCFGSCDRGFDAVALYAIAKDISVRHSIDDLKRLFNIDLEVLDRMRQLQLFEQPTPADPIAIYEQATEVHGIAQRYLVLERKISPDVISTYRLRRSDDGYIIFPHYTGPDGIIAACTGRAALPDLEPRHLTWMGPLGEPPFGLHTLTHNKYIFVAEAPIDALSLATINLPAVSVRLAGLNDSIHKTLDSFATVYLVCDGDARGREGAKSLSAALRTNVIDIALPNKQDCNSMLQRNVLDDYITSYIRYKTANPQVKEEF